MKPPSTRITGELGWLMAIPAILGLWFGLELWAFPAALAEANEPPAQPPRPVYVMRLEGAISPAAAGILAEAVEQARAGGAQALIVELDTPGGLSQAMRTMIKTIMSAPMAVVVYVSPSGAQAASAGVLVTMAADVAAMAPGTNIGAAHPVEAGGGDLSGQMEKKVVNDMVALAQSVAQERGRNGDWAKQAVEQSVAVAANEAVRLKVVDLVARDRAELLSRIHDRSIKRSGFEGTLRTAGAPVVEVSSNWRDQWLRTLADPNIAFILMMLGLAGLYFELANPGAIFPGVVGGIALILAFYSFQTLPVNYAGLLLMLLGAVFFFLEIKVTSHGLLSLGGIISLTVGSVLLFKSPEEYLRVSLSVLIPVLVAVAAFFVVVTTLVVKAQARATITGSAGMVGLTGRVQSWSDGSGTVLINGERWRAVSREAPAPGDLVEVSAVDGLTLTVRPGPNKD